MRAKTSIVLLSAILFLTAACKQKLTKDEAEKQLRAFDNEVIVTARNISETTAYSAFKKMATLNNPPLPFQYRSSNATPDKPCQFNFDDLKGVYTYDGKNNLTVKKDGSNSIVIQFPFASNNDSTAKFILTDYTEQLSAWNIYLPTRLKAQLQIGNETVATFTVEGKIEHEIPVKYEATATFSGYHIKSGLQTKLSRKKAKVSILSTISRNEKQLLLNELHIETTMNQQKQVVFNTIESALFVFPIKVKLHIDRDKMPTNTHQFISDFNKNSSISIFANQGKSKLGMAKLMDRPNNNRLNIAIVYNDGTTAYLDDFLLTVQKILNIKL
jgi:hypothetical protein